LPEPGSKDKGKNSDGEKVRNRRTRETVTVASVHFCDTCGADLGQVTCTHERRTKIDIVFEKVVEHVGAEIKQSHHVSAPLKVKPMHS
jgi:transposase